MEPKLKLIVVVILGFLFTKTAFTQAVWSFTLHGGDVFNVPLPLSVYQKNFPALHLTAHYDPKSFTLPVYWDWRFTRWKNNAAWEFEAIHLKLYLKNTTAEITDFSISHGYNLLIINRVQKTRFFDYRIGGGLVLAHPESTIRGFTYGNSADAYDMGYSISGPLVNVSIGKPFYLYRRIFFNAEIRSTWSWSRVKIYDGHANLYNWAIQAVAGLGFDFKGTNNKKNSTK